MMPEAVRSRLRRMLKTFIAALGVAAAIAFVVSLLRKRITDATPKTDAPTFASPTKEELKATAAEKEKEAEKLKKELAALQVKRDTSPSKIVRSGEPSPASKEGAERWQSVGLKTGLLSRSTVGSPPRGNTFHKPFAAFVSHMKAEAAMEARFLKEQIEKSLPGRRAFLDSDDLRDLNDLVKHVKDSDVLVLVQSKSVLTRPWCLVELVTALDSGVPIVGMGLAKGQHAFPYDFAEAPNFLADLDVLLEETTPGASAILKECGIDLEDAAFKLSTRVPKVISIGLNTSASTNVLKGTIDDLLSAMRNAKPTPLPQSREEWMAARIVRRREAAKAAAAAAPKRREAVPPPLAIHGLIEPSDLPDLSKPGRTLFVNGGGKLGDNCPLEAFCSFAAPVRLVLGALGVPFEERVLDLGDKPEWFLPIVDAPEAAKLTTPLFYHDGKWIKDSEDMFKALPELFSGASQKAKDVFAPPEDENLTKEVIAECCGMGVMMPLIKGDIPTGQPLEHPIYKKFVKIELVLSESTHDPPRLGGATGLCEADYRLGAWAHTAKHLDAIISSEPLDWEGLLPNVTKWLDGHIMPLLNQSTATGRRLQMNLAVMLSKKMPALSSRVAPELWEDIKAEKELTAADTTGVLAI